MGNESDIKSLINSFKEYRDLLTPIEQNLKDFSSTYQEMSGDIQKLNSAFNGNVQGTLDKIYANLSGQAQKSNDLMAHIDNFAKKTNEYSTQVEKLLLLMTTISDKISGIDDIEKKAGEQIERLNVLIEEKKKSYDIKELQKNLESYNVNVQKINDYINKDVALALKNNDEKIKQISDKNESVLETLLEEKTDIVKLVESYS